jgi:hypothetical protein
MDQTLTKFWFLARILFQEVSTANFKFFDQFGQSGFRRARGACGQETAGKQPLETLEPDEVACGRVTLKFKQAEKEPASWARSSNQLKKAETHARPTSSSESKFTSDART